MDSEKTKVILLLFRILLWFQIGTLISLPSADLQAQTRSDAEKQEYAISTILDSASHQIKNNPSSARELLEQAHFSAKVLHDSVAIYRYWHLMGVLESFSGNHSAALKNYLSGLEICRLINDTLAMSHTCNNLGILMERIDNPDKARHYYKLALSSYRKLNDKNGEAATLNNLGSIYQNIDSIPKALDCYQKVISLNKANGDSAMLANCYGNLGNLYRITNQYHPSKIYYEKAMRIFDYLQDTAAMARSHLNLAVLFREEGKTDVMKKHLTTGNYLASRTNEYALMVLYCEIISETYANNGAFRKAYEWRLKYETAHEKFLSTENNKQINEIQIKYETKNKARQIELLTKEQELKEVRFQQQTAKLKRVKAQLIAILTLIAMIIISAYLLIRSNKLSQKSKLDKEKIRHRDEQIKTIIHTQEAERNRFAKDLHDGLGQHLTALKMGLINYQSKSTQSTENGRKTFDFVMALFNEIYQELRNISFNIMPQELNQKGLIAATERLLYKWNNDRCKIHLFSYGVGNRLDSSKEIAIYRIIQEVINNAIKHSGSNEISITFTEHEKDLNIMIEFNGEGFDITQINQSRGNGWKNINSRLEMISGAIIVDSRPGKHHSTVIIDIPIA